MGNAAWWIKVGILAVPAIVYFIMLLPLKFPVQEREAAGNAQLIRKDYGYTKDTEQHTEDPGWSHALLWKIEMCDHKSEGGESRLQNGRESGRDILFAPEH